MECPQGMSYVGKDCVIVSKKSKHGLVQAARQYYRKSVEIMKKLKFIRGNIDPSLYEKKILVKIVDVENAFLYGDLEKEI